MTAAQSTVLDLPLSAAMREGSRHEHEAAEGSSFMVALLDGRVDEAGYAGYLKRLRTVYAAIESVGREHRSSDPLVGAVVDPALERLEALEDDIAFWSTDPAASVDSPAADDYAGRVRASSSWGGLFLAHHYTRYLGDLSGGQAIGHILTNEFGLDRRGRGVAFYDFAAIPKPKLYKDAYRARLDAAGLDPGQKGQVVDEVKVAFRLNQALFSELDATLDAHRRTPRSA